MPISTYPKLFIVKSILIELLKGFGYNVSRENLFGKVRGLLSILKVTINGKSKNEIFEIDGEKVLTKVGLGNSITSQRMNGFLSALDKVKKIIKYYE